MFAEDIFLFSFKICERIFLSISGLFVLFRGGVAVTQIIKFEKHMNNQLSRYGKWNEIV